MPCPRCGMPNPLGAPACGRCGLPLPPPPPPAPTQPPWPYPGGPPAGPPGQPPDPPAGPYAGNPPVGAPYARPPAAPHWPAPRPEDTIGQGKATSTDRLNWYLRVLLGLGAVGALGYAAWALTVRRGIFAEIAADQASVSAADAADSDRLDAILLIGCGVLAAAALVLWLLVRARQRRVRALDVVGFVVVGLGVALVVAGSVAFATLGGEASRAVTGYWAVGSGFALVGLGLLCGVAATYERHLHR